MSFKPISVQAFNKACCSDNIEQIKKWHSVNRFPLNIEEIIKKQLKNYKRNVYLFLILLYPSLPIDYKYWFYMITNDEYNNAIIQNLVNGNIILDKHDMFKSSRFASAMNRKSIIKFIGYENRTELLFESLLWNKRDDNGSIQKCDRILELMIFCLDEGVDINRLIDGESLYELHDCDKSDILIQYGCVINEKKILDRAIFMIHNNKKIIATSDIIYSDTKQKWFINFHSDIELKYANDPNYKSDIEIFLNNYVGCKIYKGCLDEVKQNIIEESMDEHHFDEYFGDEHEYVVMCVFEYQFDMCNLQNKTANYNQIEMFNAMKRCEKYGG
jgi:hypothetical protein